MYLYFCWTSSSVHFCRLCAAKKNTILKTTLQNYNTTGAITFTPMHVFRSMYVQIAQCDCSYYYFALIVTHHITSHHRRQENYIFDWNFDVIADTHTMYVRLKWVHLSSSTFWFRFYRLLFLLGCSWHFIFFFIKSKFNRSIAIVRGKK